MYLLFSGKPNEVIFFRDIQRTFPQGSNYWGTNLSQVEMAFHAAHCTCEGALPEKFCAKHMEGIF